MYDGWRNLLFQGLNQNPPFSKLGSRGQVVKASRFETTRPLRCGSGSNPMRGSCQLLTECCWFTLRNNQFLQLWKLTAL